MNIGTLQIEMSANIARIQSDMDATRRIVGGTMKDVEQYATSARRVLEAIGVTLTAAAFVGLIRGAIDAADHLNDLSKTTGIAVETLGGLGFAARQSGGNLDSVGAAAGKLNRSLAEAAAGNKQAAEAFTALGISVVDAAGRTKSADAVMVELADRFAGFRDGPEKAALALRLFGKAGAEQIPLLNEGGAALTTNIEYYKRYGGVTEEVARKADEFNDAQEKLKLLTGALATNVAASLLPTMQQLAERFLAAKEEGDGLKGTADGIALVFDGLVAAGANVAFVFGGVGREIGAIAAQVGALARGEFTGFRAISDAVKADGERARRELDEFLASLGRLPGAAAKPAPGSAPGPADGDKPPAPRLPPNDDAGKPARNDATKAALADYLNLVKSIEQKIAADQAELASSTQLTDAQKLQAKVFADIDGGFVTLTLDQKLNIDAMLQELLAVEQLNEARKEEAAWRDQIRKEIDAELAAQTDKLKADQEAVRAMQEQLDLYGLTREQVNALGSARDRDTAATLRQRAGYVDTTHDGGALRDLYLQQADALDLLAAKKDALAAKEAHDANDASAGAMRAVRDYLDTVQRAGDATHGVVTNSIQDLEEGISGLAARRKFDVTAWVDQIIQEMFRLAVVKPLLAEVFGGGGGGGGGWIGAIGGIASAYFGGSGELTTGQYSSSGFATGTNPNYGNEGLNFGGPRAAGGPVNAGTDYLVGEQGPEILRMGSQAGSITPNSQIGAGASREIKVNLINNGQPAQAKATQRETPEGLVLDVVIEAIAQDIRGGGKTHDAMQQRFGLSGGGTTPRY